MRTLACTVAAAALLLGAPVALAHQGNPNYRSVVTSVTPAAKGVDVSVLNFDDRLLLHNTSGQDVTIMRLPGQAVRAAARRRHGPGQHQLRGVLPQRGPPGRDRGAEEPSGRARVEAGVQERALRVA